MKRQCVSENKEQNMREYGQKLYTQQRVYGSSLSVIRPLLSSDKDMQIQSLHAKYLKNEIQSADYRRQLENIVGDDQIVQQAWCKVGIPLNLPGHNSQTAYGQLQKKSQTSIQQQNQVCIPIKSITASLETGNMTNPPPRKSSSGRKRPKDALDNESSVRRNNSTTPSSQKRPKDALGTASSLSSKRQKLSGPFLDHSTEPPSDATVHSGVNLMEFEDQLFLDLKEESRTSEFTKRVFLEEENKCKKQKVSGTILDLSIESFDDVNANCGINLMEEEEQLFAVPKDQSRTSEAIRQNVEEEDEKLILQKLPFQKKMAKIISEYGVKNIGKDVELCVSLCLEERMRRLINDFVRVSKQRVDFERTRHQTMITSDVGHQILLMNRKAKKDLEKKQAEEELGKNNEAHKSTGSYGERGKEKCNTTKLKASRYDDYKMEKANIAARDSVGGDDMISKWRLMAKQARQNRIVGDSAPTVLIGEDITHKPFLTSRQTPTGENRSPYTASTSGTELKFKRNPALMLHRKIVRTVSVKDVISALEREPRMSKSTLVYRLYGKICTDTSRAGNSKYFVH